MNQVDEVRRRLLDPHGREAWIEETACAGVTRDRVETLLYAFLEAGEEERVARARTEMTLGIGPPGSMVREVKNLRDAFDEFGAAILSALDAGWPGRFIRWWLRKAAESREEARIRAWRKDHGTGKHR